MLKTAVVGLGWWGNQVARVLKDSARIEIVRGVDVSPAMREAWASAHGLPVYDDYQAALDNDGLDALILTTPHSLHEHQVLRAAAAGKQVFCEKPLSLTAGSALRMIEACDDAGLVLGVGHERRYEPAMEEIGRLIAAGELGTVLHVEANYSHDKFGPLPADNWRGNVKDAPAAGWTGMGVHLTDALISMIGPVREVHACAARRVLDLPSGDVVSVHLRFHDGTTGLVGVVSATPFYGRFAVFGSKGWVEARELSHVDSPGPSQLFTCFAGGSAQTMRTLDPGVDPVRANFEAWADAVAGQGAYRFTNEERFANVAVLEALARSAETGAPQPVAQYSGR